MAKNWQVNVTLEEGEKEKIQEVYRAETINISARVAKLIREDVARLRGAK